MGRRGGRELETCPTDVIRATPEHVWELLTNPARFDGLGVKVIESPARNLAAGDRLRFGPASWATPFADRALPGAASHARARHQGAVRIRNHQTVVVSPVSAQSCRVTFNGSFSFPPGWRGRLIRRVVRGELADDPAEALARLKKTAESSAGKMPCPNCFCHPDGPQAARRHQPQPGPRVIQPGCAAHAASAGHPVLAR